MEQGRKGTSGVEFSEYKQHYSERAFWRKLGVMPRAARRAIVEKAITLWVILMDKYTPLWARVLIVGVLGYLILPLDAIPDAIPVLGYVDDALAIGMVLTQLDRFVTPAMRARVRELMPEGMKSKSTKERRTKRNEQVEDK